MSAFQIMKIFLDGILVVEGKEDASYLSNYIDSEIVVVNGFELDERTINYLKDKKIIALLDPDEAGVKIRNKLNELIPNIINVEIDVNKCIRGAKNGVAECEINEILTKLKPYIVKQNRNETTIKRSDLYELGLISSKDLRDYICKKLNLGRCNGKTFYKRLLSLNIEIEMLKKLVKEYNGN